MDYSFQRYLLSKQTVDDRALNRHVLETLKRELSAYQLHKSVIEVGAGIGTMLTRLLRWELLTHAEYTLVDEMPENTAYAQTWIPAWAAENNFRVERLAQDQLRVFDDFRDLKITFRTADVFDFIQKNPRKADLLIAHAFLDLLPMPGSLPKLFALLKPGGLAWLTINFDGVTSLEPLIDPELDAKIERLYHESMDTRATGGDSQTGRHLFGHLRTAGAEILAAGASDWVVHAMNGTYPADEAYFLNFILHFFESSLKDHPRLDEKALGGWLSARREQIARGELTLIAHQMDFLVKTP